MISRAELQIRLELERLMIPYRAEKRGADENHGYRSLIKTPEAIDEIPELFGEPVLKSFVRTINGPSGIFESVRMAHWFDTAEGQTAKRKSLAIGFIFRAEPAFAAYQNCFIFASHLLRSLSGIDSHPDTQFLLEISPAIIFESGSEGWVMDLYFSGIGADEGEARRGLDRMAGILTPLFLNGST